MIPPQMPHGELFPVFVVYRDGRIVPKVLSRLNKCADIAVEMVFNIPDKNGRWVPRGAYYLLRTDDPRRLKITLTQLQNHENLLISF